MKHTNRHKLKYSANGILSYTNLWGGEAHQIKKLRYVPFDGIAFHDEEDEYV